MNMNVEQQALLNHLRATFTITGVVPLYYQGAIAGSEFLTYAATKLYLAIELEFVYSAALAVAALSYVRLYNAADAAFYFYQNSVLGWDATAAAFKYVPLQIDDHTVYFSRITNQTFDYIKFNGYRITRT